MPSEVINLQSLTGCVRARNLRSHFSHPLVRDSHLFGYVSNPLQNSLSCKLVDLFHIHTHPSNQMNGNVIAQISMKAGTGNVGKPQTNM